MFLRNLNLTKLRVTCLLSLKFADNFTFLFYTRIMQVYKTGAFMSSTIITRFAPSPTGFLHIGGARTALFNWVFAQHMQGKMLLRIEDTDEARSTQEAMEAIINGLKWLGITWEGAAISQKAQKARHQQIAYELVEQGKAYFCYASKDEIEKMRQIALSQGKPPKYDGRWRNVPQSEHPANIKPVIRIKSPQTGTTIIKDLVQGDIEFPNKDLDDFIILRSDGKPTYMHAVVVDDHDMGITHIIRGDDHLTNAAKQIIIYNAMGWQIPQMAHIPLIHGEDGAKLSKRHGALGVDAYEKMGYLPQAIKNYLMRLGWSHGNDEIMSIDQIIKWFNIKDINKGAARFDFKKLNHLNAYYIKNTSDLELYKYVRKEINILDPEGKFKNQIILAISILKERAKTLIELLNMLEFIIKPQKAEINDTDIDLVKKIIPILSNGNKWEKSNLTVLINNFIEANNIKMPQIAKPLRLILTGQSNALAVTDILLILGKKETLHRLNNMV